MGEILYIKLYYNKKWKTSEIRGGEHQIRTKVNQIIQQAPLLLHEFPCSFLGAKPLHEPFCTSLTQSFSQSLTQGCNHFWPIAKQCSYARKIFLVFGPSFTLKFISTNYVLLYCHFLFIFLLFIR